MKRFNRWMWIVCGGYLICALLFLWYFGRIQNSVERYYLVEANRVMAEIKNLYEKQPQIFFNEKPISLNEYLSIQEHEYIVSVKYISVQQENPSALSAFYESGESQSLIRPSYNGERLLGYVRIDYQDRKQHDRLMLVLVVGLLTVGGIVFCIFWHIRKRIINPIVSAEQFTGQIAKGNLQGEMKIEKKRYLAEFQTAIGKLRDELIFARRRELKLVREKKLMLLSLTHDVKTPLSTILLSAKALQKGFYEEETEKQKAYSQIIAKSEEIQKYIADITKGSTEDLIDIPIVQEEFYFKNIMRHVQQDYQEKCKLMQVEFVVGKYPNCILKGDFHRTVEAIENLLENGLKYGDGVHLEMKFSEEEGCLLVHVINSGVPVEESEFSYLFESFYRGSNVKDRKGSGLGLYICKEIMRKMGGDVYAERLSDGMEFVLVFEKR